MAVDTLDDDFDVLVVGGGITGCGIALDAAQRGMHVLLVERGDIASGTSSRSSKLIHGGLRYLKQMQFRITRLACRERDRLLNLNPHIVHPVRFIYPAYRGDRTAGWKVDFGLWMYDRLTAGPERHSQLDEEEIHRLAPGLATDGLDRALSYTDAMADDARLTWAVAATAHAYGARILTRCEAVAVEPSARRSATTITLHDTEGGRQLRATARVVVNATGVWTDAVRDRLGLADKRLRPSRGIHLVLPRDLPTVTAAVSFPSPDDGRPVFVIPHPEGTLLGTTDVYHDGDLDDPRPSADEVGYLLRAVAAAFPGSSPARHDVLGAFAGLRPILDTHADDPSDASREEDIWEERGIVSVAGGKLTTWRSTAEDAVDAVLERLGEEDASRFARCATKGTPLAGLAPADLSDRLERALTLEPAIARAMSRRLGSLAWQAPHIARRRSELKAIAPGVDLCAAEVRAHLRWGGVLHLEDLLLRRVRIGMWQPELSTTLMRKLRPVVRSEMGWDAVRWRREEHSYVESLASWTMAGVQ